jgi:outer membrane receptor protein involved in Fe transport
VQIIDETGNAPELNGDNTFQRFNPMVGGTYLVHPGLTFYAGYAEANRAPTPAELACSDPNFPCLLESFLTADPPLDQVVSKTWEAGLRGEQYSISGQEKLEWSFGVFRTDDSDEIIQIADSQQGRGYFANFGDTRRQGIEASITYRTPRYFAYASYAFIDATFESSGIIPSENNPASSECPVTEAPDPGEEEPTCVFVRPGDRLPGIPRHRFKAGFDYKITPKWVFGADLITASDQIFYGDEGNDNTPLAGYYKINLHSSYDITDHIQIYGLIENLTDQQYGIYGTYINVDAANGAAVADPSLPANPFDEDNAKTITPAIPFAAYGGLKVKF